MFKALGLVLSFLLCAALPAASATVIRSAGGECVAKARSASSLTSKTVTTYDRKCFSQYLKTVDEYVETFDRYVSGTVLSNTPKVTYKVSASNFYKNTKTRVENKVRVVNRGLASSGKKSIGSLITTSTSTFTAFVFDQTVTFNFASEIVGFAIDINSFLNSGYKFKNGKKGTGVFTAVTNTGEVIKSLYDPFATYSEGGKNYKIGNFIGFTTEKPFTSIKITSPRDIDTRYTFKLDTLVTVPPPPPPSPVPVPPALPMLGAAVLALGLMRRKVA